jgi:hypothetical protein
VRTPRLVAPHFWCGCPATHHHHHKIRITSLWCRGTKLCVMHIKHTFSIVSSSCSHSAHITYIYFESKSHHHPHSYGAHITYTYFENHNLIIIFIHMVRMYEYSYHSFLIHSCVSQVTYSIFHS